VVAYTPSGEKYPGKQLDLQTSLFPAPTHGKDVSMSKLSPPVEYNGGQTFCLGWHSGSCGTCAHPVVKHKILEAPDRVLFESSHTK